MSDFKKGDYVKYLGGQYQAQWIRHGPKGIVRDSEHAIIGGPVWVCVEFPDGAIHNYPEYSLEHFCPQHYPMEPEFELDEIHEAEKIFEELTK